MLHESKNPRTTWSSRSFRSLNPTPTIDMIHYNLTKLESLEILQQPKKQTLDQKDFKPYTDQSTEFNFKRFNADGSKTHMPSPSHVDDLRTDGPVKQRPIRSPIKEKKTYRYRENIKKTKSPKPIIETDYGNDYKNSQELTSSETDEDIIPPNQELSPTEQVFNDNHRGPGVLADRISKNDQPTTEQNMSNVQLLLNLNKENNNPTHTPQPIMDHIDALSSGRLNLIFGFAGAIFVLAILIAGIVQHKKKRTKEKDGIPPLYPMNGDAGISAPYSVCKNSKSERIYPCSYTESQWTLASEAGNEWLPAWSLSLPFETREVRSSKFSEFTIV